MTSKLDKSAYKPVTLDHDIGGGMTASAQSIALKKQRLEDQPEGWPRQSALTAAGGPTVIAGGATMRDPRAEDFAWGSVGITITGGQR